jgi:hypothetical protein
MVAAVAAGIFALAVAAAMLFGVIPAEAEDCIECPPLELPAPTSSRPARAIKPSEVIYLDPSDMYALQRMDNAQRREWLGLEASCIEPALTAQLQRNQFMVIVTCLPGTQPPAQVKAGQ